MFYFVEVYIKDYADATDMVMESKEKELRVIGVYKWVYVIDYILYMVLYT